MTNIPLEHLGGGRYRLPRQSLTDLYLYRCTTDKLTHHLEHISESGDTVLWPVFVGGRDWVLICQRGNY